jgi:hypothetical protein
MTEEIMLEMNWRTAVPMLVEIIANAETPKARMDARDELLRCARIADHAVSGRKELADLLSRAAAFCEDIDSLDHEDRMDLVEDLLAAEAPLRPKSTDEVDAASPSPEPTDA